MLLPLPNSLILRLTLTITSKFWPSGLQGKVTYYEDKYDDMATSNAGSR